jgi:hypothetical protein
MKKSLSALCESASQAAQATLAQLVERLIRNQQVAGSIPAGGSSFKSITYGPGEAGFRVFISQNGHYRWRWRIQSA